MKTRTTCLSLLLALCAAPAARAGDLDLDYNRTSPAKALVCSVAFPGAGHYYLSKKDPKYRGKAWLFMALGLGTGAFLASEFRHKGDDALKLSAALLAGGVKIWEFGDVTSAAEAERLNWFKANFRPAEAAPAPAPAR